MSNASSSPYEQMKQVFAMSIGSSHMFENWAMDFRSLPDVNVSYSSSGEDLWLRQFMKPRLREGLPGFYIDLGANHPTNTSNSFLFYSYGWRGICIDANLRFRDDFAALRPRDVFVNAAVSDIARSLYFAEYDAPAGHKVGRVLTNPAHFSAKFTAPVEVPALTLAAILKQYVPAHTEIDFLSIDVEDSELPALRSNDWTAYRPRVILIEAGRFNPIAPFDYPTIAFLRDQGYRYEGYASNNVLMSLASV